MLHAILTVVAIILYVVIMEITLHYISSNGDKCTTEYACRVASATVWPYAWFLICVAAVLRKIR